MSGDKEAVFLTEDNDISELGKFTIGLASYPRSGNSLLRTLLEKTTGVVTGTDSRPDRTLIQQLTEMGFRGEGVVDERVLFVKTHYPERTGYKQFCCNAVILLVRNPFDAIVSYFNMVLTQSHTKTIEATEYDKFKNIWVDFVAENAVVFSKFHDEWCSKKISKEIPTHIVKFEDLANDQLNTMKGIHCFVVESLRNLQCSPKILEAFSDRIENNLQFLETTPKHLANKYAPRGFSNDAKKKTFHYLDRYSEVQIRNILAICKPFLVKFGYWKKLAESGIVEDFDFFRINSSCLLLRKAKSEDEADTETESTVLELNANHALRERTNDDPYGRGFGTRWKRLVTQLPPIKIEGMEEPYDFSNAT